MESVNHIKTETDAWFEKNTDSDIKFESINGNIITILFDRKNHNRVIKICVPFKYPDVKKGFTILETTKKMIPLNFIMKASDYCQNRSLSVNTVLSYIAKTFSNHKDYISKKAQHILSSTLEKIPESNTPIVTNQMLDIVNSQTIEQIDTEIRETIDKTVSNLVNSTIKLQNIQPKILIREQEVSNLKTELSNLKDVQEKNSLLEQELSNLRTELSNLKDVQEKNSLLEQEVSNLKTELSRLKDVEQQKSTLESIIKDMENEIVELRKNVGPKPLDIKNYIDQSLLDKIHKLQEQSYRIDHNGVSDVMCCVCLEEDIKIVPLKCAHELCDSCFEKVKEQPCPICRNPMEITTIHKLIAVVTKINQTDMAIFYLPPIYDNDKWIEYDVFVNLAGNKDEIRRFLTVCNRINEECYSVVVNGDVLNPWKKFNVVRCLDIIVVN
jgi:hypothetical protein